MTALGARFDGEVDAFLILALSVYVAPISARGCSLIGAARYLFLLGEWLLPWMRAPLPPRRWRKVVAAAQGIVLDGRGGRRPAPGGHAGASCSPRSSRSRRPSASACGGCGAAGPRTRRGAAPRRRRGAHGRRGAAGVGRRWSRRTRSSELDVGAFVRLPLELLVVLVLAVLLPARPRRVLAVVAGAVLALLMVVKVLDMGFITAFDRPFDPISDSTYVGIGVETLRDAIGRSSANIAVAAIVVLARRAARHPGARADARHAGRRRPPRLGAPGEPPCSASSGSRCASSARRSPPRAPPRSPSSEVQTVQSGLAAQRILAREIPRDRFRSTPGDRLLTGLRGKDVLLLFVESYGQVAVQGSSFSPGVDAVLDRGTAQLDAARLLLAQRLPVLVDLRRAELAGARHPAVGDPDRHPAGLQPARQERPRHPQPGVQARRLADGRRGPGEQAHVAGGQELLRLRQGLRPPQRRLPRARLRPAPDARPVRPEGTARPRAGQARPAAAVRRGRPHLQPRAVDADPAAHPLGGRRRRLDLPPRPAGGGHDRPRSSATPSGPAPPTATRSSTR